ncbi:oligopeptidase B [Ignavibacteria bacterium]|nr:S9 family peptidase [Bacteroidota bacterium]MCZ2132958.1 S9 family peptidase [Bacteroidota bacterium]
MTQYDTAKTALPIAVKKPHTIQIHDVTLLDDYFWLREKTKPEVLDYLNAENDYTAAVMQPAEELQDTLYREMRGRIKETDISEFDRYGDYFYYSRTEEGKQYSIFCRRRAEENGKEEILLDVNELAAPFPYFTLGTLQISPDHLCLAYSYETDGSEHYAIAVKTLATGEIVESGFRYATSSVLWLNDNKRIIYLVQDESFRPYKVMLHTLGEHTDNDIMLYCEKDESFHISLDKSFDNRYILVNIGSQTTSETLYADADGICDSLSVFIPRRRDIEYDTDHNSGVFYIRTNDGGKNFRLLSANANNIADMREILPHRPHITLSWVLPFDTHIVLGERENGLPHIAIIEKSTGNYRRIAFPEAAYDVASGHNFESSASTFRCKYSSFTTPLSVFDISFADCSLKLIKKQEILGDFDSANYTVERIFVTASDGIAVPVTLLYRKGLEKNGKNPTLLYGYGSYGANMPDSFRLNLFSLIDRGFIYALAHIRGGGEMGEQWHDDGKLLKKRNTFTDFISCAEYLVNNDYTSPQFLACQGGSAGGLLIGATLNMRHDLFGAAIADVPFVDVINTMLDDTLPLTVIEYEEWGNPNDKEYFDYMKSYSPYDNITTQAYPNILALAGLNDPRVQYWEPAKWVAKLRRLRSDNKVTLLKTNMSAGHFGASGRFDYLKETAFRYAFLIYFLNA